MLPIPASTGPPGSMLVADSMGHMCLRSPDMAKMDPNAADVALAVKNGSAV